MRDYVFIDRYLNELLGDIYAQPWDSGHNAWAEEVVMKWFTRFAPVPSVLDVGAGDGFCQDLLSQIDINDYTGISIGEDVAVAKSKGRNVTGGDYHFLPFLDESFDLVLSRHSLEHSPMPLLALMEWHRVARHWLCLILPNPVFWTYVGKNHYSVMPYEQAVFLLSRAGWRVMWNENTKEELRFMCEKVNRFSGDVTNE